MHAQTVTDAQLRDRTYISRSLIFHSCRIAPRNLNFYTKAKVKEGKITLSKASIFALARDRVIYIEITPSGKRIDWRISRHASVRLARMYLRARMCMFYHQDVYDEGYISLSAKEWLGNVQARWNSSRIALRGSSLFGSWMKISRFLQNVLEIYWRNSQIADWKMTRDLRVGIDKPQSSRTENGFKVDPKWHI